MKCFVLLCFLSLHFFLTAQPSLQSGWVQLNNGDTVYGQLQERDWHKNPDQISFVLKEKMTYTVSELLSFGLNNGITYKRYRVSRLLLPNNDDVLFPEGDAGSDTVVVWLKILVSGDFTLGGLFQNDRSYFYLIKRDGSATELLNSKGIRSYTASKYFNDPRYGKNLLEESPLYKNQLIALFPGKFSAEQLQGTAYTETELSKLFRRLNNATDEKQTGRKIRIGVGGGVSYYSNTINGEFPALFYQTDFKDVVWPFIRVSFDFLNKRKRTRFSFVPEFGISLLHTSGAKSSATVNGDFELNSLFLETALITRFIANPAARHKFYLDAGLNVSARISGKNTFKNYGSTGNNTLITAEPEQKSFLVAPTFAAGYMTNRIRFFVNYQHIGNMTVYDQSTWSVSRISMGAIVAVN